MTLAESGSTAVPVIQLSVPATGMSADDVRKLLAEERAAQADAAKQLAENLAAARKLLSDIVNVAAGLDEDTKKALADEVADLITPEMSAAQIKRLAEMQVKKGNDLAVAKKLAAMGWQAPAGSVHISVDSSNQVKSLQATADKRLGLEGMPDSRRFALTGGVLQPENKALAA